MAQSLGRKFGRLCVSKKEDVTFLVHNNLLRAKYKNSFYRVHYLDLRQSEHRKLAAVQAPNDLTLSVCPSDVVIVGNVLNIRRIHEENIKGFGERIEFSSGEPLMARYKCVIYLVNHDLRDQYESLLSETNCPRGTAIRVIMIEDWIMVDQTNTLIFRMKRLKATLKKRIEKCRENATDKEVCTEINGKNCKTFQRYIVGAALSLWQVEERLLRCSDVRKSKEICVKYGYKEDRGKLQTYELDDYAVPGQICKIVRDKEPFEKIMPELNFWLTNMDAIKSDATNYINSYRTAISLEEEEQNMFVESFNLTDVVLTKDDLLPNIFYFPIEKEMTELSAAIDENYLDRCCLVPNMKKNSKILAQINKKCHGKIYIEILKVSGIALNNILHNVKNEQFAIEFLLNRIPYQVQHQALDFVRDHKLFNSLLSHQDYFSHQQKISGCRNEFQGRGNFLEYLNAEQLMAVQNIVDGRNYPLPYVLFGPPGTGKTKTLVAAIEQIVRTTTKNILVCAMSNAACDEITDRLIDVLSSDEMFRLYASCQKLVKKSRITAISNGCNGQKQNSYPSLKYLYKFRVLICTLCTAGTLTRAHTDKLFDSSHFSYVFIDECASSHESMTLIPIAGLCTSPNRVNTNIVLAGDPKQLGAITKNDLAKRLGYSTSLMDRLMEYQLYKRDPISGEFNATYITQLIKNYRSHPDILKIPNELFYENKLVASASTSITDRFINSRILPSKTFPIIFESVQGKCERSKKDFSFFNRLEISSVLKYVQMLMHQKTTQADIGIVSPYKKQCRIITQRCKDSGLNNITIGTAEVFQGKEKPVMIIPTIRSGRKSLGFVSEPRRLNVIVTRAKCLLIIIGDPFTLRLDANWRRLIEFCFENKGFIQGKEQFTI